MEPYYVGLDVHRQQSAFVIEDGSGEALAQGMVPTTRAALESLRVAHRLPPGTGVALETGTVAFFVARQLASLGLEPVVIDAHEVRLKAHRPRQKSDRRDAFELCEGLRRGIYRAIVHVRGARYCGCERSWRAGATSCGSSVPRSVRRRPCCAARGWAG